TFAHLSEKQVSRWRPKIFLGYSDMTYIHQTIQNQLGWVTFHGPLIGSLDLTRLKKCIQSLEHLKKPSRETWSEAKPKGKGTNAEGRLVGGTLSLLSLTGKNALPREPVILALEDVNENFYRIDRMIWNL